MLIQEVLKDCASIGITGHENPDGDCAGSCLALAMYLEKAMPGARVDVFLESLRPELAKNIPGAQRVITDFRTDLDRYDAMIVLDSAKNRTSGAEALFDRAKLTVNIDHHVSNPGCGTYNRIDGAASSACELLYGMIDPALIDCRIAQALYVGMVTDTGCFRFSNTSQKTMEIAGKLLTYGFDFPAIVREVYFEKTWIQQRMLGKALMKSKSLLGGRCIISRLRRESILSLGGEGKDVEGIVSALVSTTGADCAVFGHERPNGEWRISFRSNSIVNVAAIAEEFGGGGHVRASGCTLRATQSMEKTFARIVEMVKEQLEASAPQPGRN